MICLVVVTNTPRLDLLYINLQQFLFEGMTLFFQRIGDRLQETIGLKLIDVDYFCFSNEIEPSEVEQNPFYIGGEVILKFEDEKAVVTWDENAGWQNHFSVYYGKQSLFLPTSSLVLWNVAIFQPWKDCINKQLLGAEVYGDNETPHIIKLNFDSTSIFLGNGRETKFGDGDDLIIATSLTGDNQGGWEKLWSSTYGLESDR